MSGNESIVPLLDQRTCSGNNTDFGGRVTGLLDTLFWFRGSGLWTFTSCGLTTQDDSAFSVYRADGGERVRCIDDSCDIQTTLSYLILPNDTNTYYFKAGFYDEGTRTGGYDFDWFVESHIDDLDGVDSCSDSCPGSDIGRTVDSNGCSEYQIDSDGDGVCENGVSSNLWACPGGLNDRCPNTRTGDTIDPSTGCALSDVDSDGDGVCADRYWCSTGIPDQCENTLPGMEVDPTNGCSAAQLDTDGDGLCEILHTSTMFCTGVQDQCKNTDPGDPIDPSIGCSAAQLDTDGDGLCEKFESSDFCTGVRDKCKRTNSGDPIDPTNGCSAVQLDTDGDGLCEKFESSIFCTGVRDRCKKTDPGEMIDPNGCSAAQLDTDGDGVCEIFESGSMFCTGIRDQCHNTPSGTIVDPSNGCSKSQLDLDNDGVCDIYHTSTLFCTGVQDQCSGTSPGATVDPSNGCTKIEVDPDDDGVCDTSFTSIAFCNGTDDKCPGTIADTMVDVSTGCSQLEVDADGDGVCNTPFSSSEFCTGTDDKCPNTIVGATVDNTTGCTRTEVDPDGDGVCDTPFTASNFCSGAYDRCPNTPGGSLVDENGCSISEIDPDSDRVCDVFVASSIFCSGEDFCPGTATGAVVDDVGCAVGQIPSAPLDVVFFIDESGSIKNIQSTIGREVSNFFNELSQITSGRFRAGLIGFGADELNGYPIIRQTLTSDAGSFEEAVGSLKVDGRFEPGLLAVSQAGNNSINGQELSPIAFPGPKGFCAVLFSDEDSDVPSGSTAEEQRAMAQAALDPGAFISVVSGNCGDPCAGIPGDYKDWADATYNIGSFNSNTAQSILDGIVEQCFQMVVLEGGTCASLTLSVDDSCQVPLDQVPSAGTLYQESADEVNSLSFAAGLELPSPLTVGTFPYAISYAFVENGKQGSCQGALTVIDEQSPVLNCPADTTLHTDPGECFSTVTLDPAILTDNCDILDPIPMVSPAGVVRQELGEKVYSVASHTDASGNPSNSCQTKVTVMNRQPLVDAGGPYVVAVDRGDIFGLKSTELVGTANDDGAIVTTTWATDCPSFSFLDSLALTTTVSVAGGTEPTTCSVTLTATGSCGGSTSGTAEVVIVDPTAGFITGGGRIASPVGALVGAPSENGQATFSFVSKYKKNRSLPEGNVNFVIKGSAARFHFQSRSHAWLIVNKSDCAQLKGEGTVRNTAGTFEFVMTVCDNGEGKNADDEFRIQIWDKSNGAIVYDNMMGAPDGYNGDIISGGNIQIHYKGNKKNLRA